MGRSRRRARGGGVRKAATAAEEIGALDLWLETKSCYRRRGKPCGGAEAVCAKSLICLDGMKSWAWPRDNTSASTGNPAWNRNQLLPFY